MTDSTDYEDILEGTVEEAKNTIRELDEPDYEKLLETEIEGKNRKTLRDWLENELEQQEYEVGKEDALNEMLLGSLSPTSALAGGLVIGLIIGLVAASFGPLAQDTDRVPPGQVQDSVRELVTSGGFNGTVDVSRPTTEHGLYYVNVNMTQDDGNETVSRSQEAYVTFDSQLLIPIQRNPLTGQMMNPVNLPQALAQSQQGSNTTGQ